MGGLLASTLAFAAALRQSQGGPEKDVCDRMVATMTATALRHGRDAAVGLLRRACSHEHNSTRDLREQERRLTPLRFLGEALFQLRPPSSTATSIDEYITTDIRARRMGRVAPRATAQAPLVEALLLTAQQGLLAYSDDTTDWTVLAVESHGMHLDDLPELHRLYQRNSSATRRLLDVW